MPFSVSKDASQAERRITVRLVTYWEKLREGRAMPTEDDINPEDLADLWDYCFLVQVGEGGKGEYSYTYLGSAIMEAYRAGLSVDDSGVLVGMNANKLAPDYARLIQTQKPLIDEGEFTNLRNETVRYRQALLPLGNGTVDAIFGGMRFKIVTGQPAD